jgi:hypothetical protein
MICTFQVGQRVVCIENNEKVPDGYQLLAKPISPVVGAIYTVATVRLGSTSGEPCITLKEIPPQTVEVLFNGVLHEAELCFHSEYFRPVVERTTDISIFTRMLNTTPETVGAA